MRNSLLQLPAQLLTFILTTPLLSSHGAHAIQQIPIPSPNLDLSQLGRVAIAGDFDSISLYQYQGQNEDVYNNNGSQSLLTRYPDGQFQTLLLADAYIEAMCPFVVDGEFQGLVLGGNFTSLDGTKSTSAGLYHPDTGAVDALPGLTGRVSALLCDNERNTVYFGGMFSAGDSTNAMSWTTNWTSLPFAGFNGPVTSITKNAAGNIVFGGQFDGLGNTSTPSMPDGQVINLTGGEVTASASTDMDGFDDPRNIICKTGDEDGPGNTWLLPDGQDGWWEGSYGYGYRPTKLRLYNTDYEGRGTKTFYFENMNSGGILNLNYLDASGNNQSCQSNCPLPQGNTSYQDFHFVPAVGMSSFRIFITDYYGDGAGLSGIELFQDEIYSFAIDEFNEPQCDGLSNGSSSTVTPSDGLWQRIANNGTTSSDYLSAYFTEDSQKDNVSVVFMPSLAESGNYSITIYTPGCVEDETCDTRGVVNMTGTMTQENQAISTTIYQTNDYDKFDQIYYGYVDVSDPAFAPSVTLAPVAGQIPQTVVAQRIRFELVTTTGGLNGLYEYDPRQADVDTDFEDSPINSAGADLDRDAIINAVVTSGDRIFVGGSFSGDGIANFMSVSDEANSPPGGGLNDNVQAIYIDGTTLYVGGNFTNTQDGSVEGLNSVAIYNIDSDEWVAMGAGVNGVVAELVPVALNITEGQEENCITVNGNFSQVNGFGDAESFRANGFAVWVPSRKNWLQNVPNHDIAVDGMLYAQTEVPGSPTMYAGQIISQALGLSGAVMISNDDDSELQSLGVQLEVSNSSSSNMRKRAIDADDMASGVYTGLFYEGNGNNVTVLGGHFDATTGDGSTVSNLIFIAYDGDEETITGIEGLDQSSTIAAMDNHDNLLFAGGSLTGTAGGNDLNGIVVYDLDAGRLATPQPPALSGDQVIVNAVAEQPSSSSVFVGGSFSEAGSLSCEALCIYDTSTEQWNVPGVGLGGTITSMFWSSKTQLIISGDLTLGSNQTTMATYDAKKREFTQYTGAGSLPGPITVLSPANGQYNEFWAAGLATENGSAFLSKFADDRWTGVGGLGPGTNIRGVQVLSLTEDHEDTNLVDAGETLMIVGNLNLPDFGNASAVLFNGTDFSPFILTNKDDGSQGTIAGIFVSNPQNLMKISGGHLDTGFVVLIGLAIALALIFLIVVAGILIERRRRKKEGYVPMSLDRNGNLSRIPPETLLGGIGEKDKAPKI